VVGLVAASLAACATNQGRDDAVAGLVSEGELGRARATMLDGISVASTRRRGRLLDRLAVLVLSVDDGVPDAGGRELALVVEAFERVPTEAEGDPLRPWERSLGLAYLTLACAMQGAWSDAFGWAARLEVQAPEAAAGPALRAIAAAALDDRPAIDRAIERLRTGGHGELAGGLLDALADPDGTLALVVATAAGRPTTGPSTQPVARDGAAARIEVKLGGRTVEASPILAFPEAAAGATGRDPGPLVAPLAPTTLAIALIKPAEGLARLGVRCFGPASDMPERSLRFVVPPAAGDRRLRVIRVPASQERWMETGRVIYANDRSSPRTEAAGRPYVLGGRCVRSPGPAAIDAYHDHGVLLGMEASDLLSLYRAEGIRVRPPSSAADPLGLHREPVTTHVLEGGRSLHAPLAPSLGYGRIFGRLHEDWTPRSSLARDWRSRLEMDELTAVPSSGRRSATPRVPPSRFDSRNVARIATTDPEPGSSRIDEPTSRDRQRTGPPDPVDGERDS